MVFGISGDSSQYFKTLYFHISFIKRWADFSARLLSPINFKFGMRTIVTTILLVSFSFLYSNDFSVKSKRVYNIYKDNIVEIITNNGYGTGFYYNNNKIIITALHLVSGAKQVLVETKDGRFEIEKVYRMTDDLDIAILVLEKNENSNKISYKVASSKILDPVLLISNPMGLKNTVTTGYITNIIKTDTGHFYVANAYASLGSSGGPVFNLNGSLIGVQTAYYDKKHQHIIPFTVIKNNFNSLVEVQKRFGRYHVERSRDLTWLSRIFEHGVQIFKNTNSK